MTNEPVKAALRERNVPFEERPDGDIFFVRNYDGRGMYVRSHEDGTYDWSIGAGPRDPLMDYTAPERHDLEEVGRRIDDFLGLIVAGPLVIDTLSLVRRSMESGMGRETAEKVAHVARDLALKMHEAGMDAHEIRNRFAYIHEQLKRERLVSLGKENQMGGQLDRF